MVIYASDFFIICQISSARSGRKRQNLKNTRCDVRHETPCLCSPIASRSLPSSRTLCLHTKSLKSRVARGKLILCASHMTRNRTMPPPRPVSHPALVSYAKICKWSSINPCTLNKLTRRKHRYMQPKIPVCLSTAQCRMKPSLVGETKSPGNSLLRCKHLFDTTPKRTEANRTDTCCSESFPKISHLAASAVPPTKILWKCMQILQLFLNGAPLSILTAKRKTARVEQQPGPKTQCAIALALPARSSYHSPNWGKKL